MFGPRKYIVDSTDSQTKFIGRYTIQETADADFNYPGSFTANNTDPFNSTPTGANQGPDLSIHPHDPADPGDAVHPHGLVHPYDDDTFRRGEDIVMTNVHEFDIQVWDDAIRDFVNLGHSLNSSNGNPGWFHQSRNQNATFGESPTGNDGNSFDTWHPFDGEAPSFGSACLSRLMLPLGRMPPILQLPPIDRQPIQTTVWVPPRKSGSGPSALKFDFTTWAASKCGT